MFAHHSPLILKLRWLTSSCCLILNNSKKNYCQAPPVGTPDRDHLEDIPEMTRHKMNIGRSRAKYEMPLQKKKPTHPWACQLSQEFPSEIPLLHEAKLKLSRFGHLGRFPGRLPDDIDRDVRYTANTPRLSLHFCRQ